MVSPILVALDYTDLGSALSMAESTRDHVGGFKVGLKLIMGEGPDAVSRIADLGLPVFADAKLHDIPHQVRDAASGLSGRGARWVTVHATGGREMMSAAVEGLQHGAQGRDVGALAVTVLTSLDEADLAEIGLGGPVSARAASLATLAEACGAEGYVCSPNEVAGLKSAVPELLAVTPGIRPGDVGSHDQKRVATPEAAIAAGADFLVVGRAITGASDPAEAAARISESLSTGV